MFVGQKIGRLTLLETVKGDRGNMRWLCRCECGQLSIPKAVNLQNVRSQSCGCKRATRHGLYHSRAYGSWGNMIQRCTNSKRRGFENWGGRGIGVCERWRVFQEFFEDMGERPLGYELHRIDNRRGYEPVNCEWVQRLDHRRLHSSHRR